MNSSQETVLERRGIPGSSLSLSVVAISVEPPAVAPPSADARALALLRRARSRGVTTFDIARARFTSRAERMIANAFPAPDPEIAVIVGRSMDSLAAERGASGESGPNVSVAEALTASLEESRRRLAPNPVSVVEWDPTPGSGSKGSDLYPALPHSEGARPPQLFALRLAPTATSLPPGMSPPALFVGDLSLLEDGAGPLFDSVGPDSPARLIARDPFSQGRLDGTRFAAAATPPGPAVGPVDVRRLHEEFDPVLRLGFLTEHHRRTLAQAALRFTASWPFVATCVIPLPTPERFEEVLNFESTPPLSEEELEHVRRVK